MHKVLHFLFHNEYAFDFQLCIKAIPYLNHYFCQLNTCRDCILEILSDSQLQELENKTSLDMNKNAIHIGPLSKEKMVAFFSTESVKSAVISVMKLKSNFGLLKIGSNEPTKYLGDGDTTFIEYIRDIIVGVLESKEA